MLYFKDIFHYMLKAEVVTLVSLKVRRVMAKLQDFFVFELGKERNSGKP